MGESPGKSHCRVAGTDRSPVIAQDSQQPGREHDVAILTALALLDANDPAPAVDVGRP